MSSIPGRPEPSEYHEHYGGYVEQVPRGPILELLRRSHVLMFRGLPEEAWLRRGVAGGREFSVRSFPWILVGHEIHHRRILRERYLSGAAPGE